MEGTVACYCWNGKGVSRSYIKKWNNLVTETGSCNCHWELKPREDQIFACFELQTLKNGTGKRRLLCFKNDFFALTGYKGRRIIMKWIREGDDIIDLK